MLTSRTKQRGPIAVRGLMADRIGIDCKMALARNTIFESRRNCNSRHFGTKLKRLYLAVNTQLSGALSSAFPSWTRLSVLSFYVDNVPISFNVHLFLKSIEQTSLYHRPVASEVFH